MNLTKVAKTAMLSFAMVAGVWSVKPAVVKADDDACFMYPGCCANTSQCGSPAEWRCCLPKAQEAPCADDPCVDYCYHQTSCTGGY